MPRKKRATSEQPVERSRTSNPTLTWDPTFGLCGHVNRHYFGPGECVCTLPKEHGGFHEGDYVNGDGEKRRGAWWDAAGEPVEGKTK